MIDRKLGIIRDTYGMLNAEAQAARAEILELAIVLLIAGVPVALTLGTVGFVFGILGFGTGLFNLLPARIYGVVANYQWLAIPLFVRDLLMLIAKILKCLAQQLRGAITEIFSATRMTFFPSLRPMSPRTIGSLLHSGSGRSDARRARPESVLCCRSGYRPAGHGRLVAGTPP